MLDADQRAGRAELPDPLPIGSSGQRVVDLAARAAAAVGAGGAARRRRRARRRPRAHHATPCASCGLGVAELEVAEAQRRRHARRRPPDVPPPADALGGLPRRAPGRPPRRPPGARRHAARRARRRGPGTSPAPRSVPTRRSPRRSTRRRAVTAQRGAPAQRGPLVGAGQPAVAGRRPTGSAGCAWPPAPSSTPAWRRRPAGCSTGPTPSSLEHPDADDLIERIRRQQLRCRLPPSERRRQPSRRSACARRRRRGRRRRARPSPSTCSSTPSPPTSATAPSPTWPARSRRSMALRDASTTPGPGASTSWPARCCIASGAPGGEAAARPLHGDDRPRPARPADALFLAEVLAPSLGVPAPHRRRPTRCSPTSTPTCGRGAPCAR